MSKKAILAKCRNSESQEGMHLPEDDAQGSVPNPLSSTETVEEQMTKLQIRSAGEKIQSNDIPMEGACGGKDATPEHTSRYYLDSLDRVPDDDDVKRSSRRRKKAKRSRQAIALPGSKDPTSNDALLWKNVKFFIRDTVVLMRVDGQKLFADRRITPDEFRIKFCLPLLVDLQNREEMLRQKKFVDMEIKRQWQEILDEDNMDLFTDAEIFKGELTHAFELCIRESAVKFQATQVLVTEGHTEKMFFLKLSHLFNVSCYEIMLPFVRAIPGFQDLDPHTQANLCHSPALVDCFLVMINIWYDSETETISFPNGMKVFQGGFLPSCKHRGGGRKEDDTRIGDVFDTLFGFVAFFLQQQELQNYELVILMAACLIFEERNGILYTERLGKIKFAILDSITNWCFLDHGLINLEVFVKVLQEIRKVGQQISNELKRASECYNRK